MEPRHDHASWKKPAADDGYADDEVRGDKAAVVRNRNDDLMIMIMIIKIINSTSTTDITTSPSPPPSPCPSPFTCTPPPPPPPSNVYICLFLYAILLVLASLSLNNDSEAYLFPLWLRRLTQTPVLTTVSDRRMENEKIMKTEGALAHYREMW